MAKKAHKPLTPEEESSSRGPMQVVARNLTRWLMMLGVGLGVLGGTAAYMGLLVVASMLVSIVFVAFTLYLFLRLWPEDEPIRRSQAPVETPVPDRKILVSAVKVDGSHKTRFVMALRDMVRRQESFQISQQGAEMFAKTIRFMLRQGK